MRKMTVTFCLATLLGCGFIASHALAWEPSEFQFFCGSPANSRETEEDLERKGKTSEADYKAYRWGQVQWRSNRVFYRDNLGKMVDYPADQACLPDERKSFLEEMAFTALAVYRNTGKEKKRQFTSPSPKRLGPVVLDETGERVVRLFADPTFGDFADTLGFGCGSGICDWSIGITRFNVPMLSNRPPQFATWMVAHELFHTVQNAQQIYDEGSGVTFPGAYWVMEGTADAISHDLVRKRYGKPKMPLTVHGSRSFYGLRPYHRGLTWKSSAADKDRWNHQLVSDYTLSSFWTHLAERYHDGGFYYLVDWFAVPPRGDDWLNWADELMRFPDGDIAIPMYLVYPDFIAHYAAWGEKKYPHIGEDTWLEESFDGCRTVELRPGKQVVAMEYEMEHISARCVKVRVSGLSAGTAASVIWTAYDSSRDNLDNVHLAASRLGGKLVETGKPFDCFEATRGSRNDVVCLDKPFTGQRGEVKQSDDGDWVKTWLGHLQASAEGEIENLMMVVHAPVRPTDGKHDVNRQKKQQKLRLQIGLETVEMTTSSHGKAKTAAAGVNGVLSSGLVPMRSGEGNPETQLGNMFSALSGDPDAMSRMMFQQNTLAATTMNVGGNMEGLEFIALGHQVVRPGAMGGDLQTSLGLSVVLDEPIPFGAVGTYQAMINGAAGDDSDGDLIVGAREGPSATVRVLEYTDDILRLEVRGEYCFRADYDFMKRKCRQVQSIEANVVKPFGWAYDSSRIFSSVDTPGMAEYRKLLQKGLAGMFPGGEPAAPGDGGAETRPRTGNSSQAGQVDGCDCSCTEYARLNAIQEAWSAEAEAQEEAGGFGGFPPPEVMKMVSCAFECGQRWDACPVDE